MPKPSWNAAREERPGSVRVTVAGPERRLLPRVVRLAVIALTALLASAGVVVGIRALNAPTGSASGSPPDTLDARSAAANDRAVPGSSKLTLLGPRIVADTRAGSPLAPGASAPLILPALPPSSTAVLLGVSLVAATGPGAVSIQSGPDEIPALRLPAAGAMTSATVVVPVGADRGLQVRTDGGGHLVVQLVGAFEPAQDATSGRLVPVPNTRVLKLVPATDGKDATIDLAAVPALPEPGQIAAVLLQMAADVGRNGGSVTVDGVRSGADQRVFWAPTAGDDRTRTGFLVVPVLGTTVDLHYEAGTLLEADLVGYITAEAAPRDTAGLVVPLAPRPAEESESHMVGPGATADVAVVPPEGLDGVPTSRVAAALVRVAATGVAPGGVTVSAPGSTAPRLPTLIAAPGALRSIQALVGTVDGTVQVGTESGASVSINPQALILTR